MCYNRLMIEPSQTGYPAPVDDFWTIRLPIFTAQFPTYYTKPQKVWGRFHISEEKYSVSVHEIIPINEKAGKRTYVMMQPYVRKPILGITVQTGKIRHQDRVNFRVII
jgi:hypothetical protein